MTNAERWLVARYCGWTIGRCSDPDCEERMDEDDPVLPCPERCLVMPDGVTVAEENEAWFSDMPSADELAEYLPAFDSDPAQVVPMLEAMAKDGKKPGIATGGGAKGWEAWASAGEWDTRYSEGQTIPAAVFAACLACAKEKFDDQ